MLSAGECALRSPSELLRAHGLHAKKSWGQNFLHDRNVVARIADAARLTRDDVVVEIGAGLGALTVALVERAGRVIAIERDRELAAVLRAELGDVQNLEIVEANALTLELTDVARGAPVHVVGNLPYQISSPLLFRLLDQRAYLRRATLMFQRELAERIVAPPGSRVYGAPSVLVQHYANVTLTLTVGRGAFTPPPKVDSSVIQLTPRADIDTPSGFAELVRAAFGQRRKMLPRAVARIAPRERVIESLESLGLAPTLRAESLSPDDFVALARSLAEMP